MINSGSDIYHVWRYIANLEKAQQVGSGDYILETGSQPLGRHGPSSHHCFIKQKVFSGGYFYQVVIFLLY